MESMSDPPSPSFVPDGESRLSTARIRPPLPQGPRIPYNKHPQIHNLSPTSTASSPSTSTFSPSICTSRLASPAQSLPLINLPITAESIPPSYVESPDITVHSPILTLPHRSRTLLDVGVQTSPPPSPTTNSEPKLAVKVIPKSVALVPPPDINFDSIPISFRGLSFEAAQWTFTSAELQEIVSRAIRLSARESFIRVLSIEMLDKGVVKENERLATLKLTTQSQYRFQVHRRTMLLQALNSSASATPHNPDTISSLAGQLSETTAQCDRLMEVLLQISDQQSQLTKAQNLHSASALAIALRKINKSYERRVNELRGAQDKIEVLEAELEEAWKEAEKVAQEIDNLEAGMSDDEGDDSEVTGHTARVVGVTGKVFATTATLVSPTEVADPPVLEPYAARGTDAQAAESDINPCRRSSERNSRWNRVTAAKTRSRRTSHGSLRVTKRSLSRAGRGSEDKIRPRPPVPILPERLQGNSFLDLESKHPSANTSLTRDGNVTRTLPPVKPEESVHPSPAVAIPAIIPPVWLLAESPSKANPEERDRVLSMLPFPRVRHDSAARSSSAYSNLKPRQIRHSVPILSSPPSDFVNDPTPRSETP